MANGATVDEMWRLMESLTKAVKEIAEEHKKTEAAQQKTEAAQQKTEAALQETQTAQQKTEAAQQKTEAALINLSNSLNDTNGNFNNKWGEFLENFIEGDLIKIFKKRNVEVNRILPRATVKQQNGIIKAEYDFIIPDGNIVIVVEVKNTFSSNKLDTFMDKLNRFKEYFPEYGKCKIYGAIAYVKAKKELLENAQEYGLYLIQAPGGENNVTIIANPEGFTPTAY